MRIHSYSVPHDEQRYDTVGDWFFQDGELHVVTSHMSDPRYETLVALHEIVEAVLCAYGNVPQHLVDEFDFRFKDAHEPGDDIRAPYYKQHQIATAVERLVAAELGVDWRKYEAEVSAL